MTTNQLLIQYVTLTINHPDGDVQIVQLSDFIRPENITEAFADDIISRLTEEEIKNLKHLAEADYKLRGEKLVFLD